MNAPTALSLRERWHSFRESNPKVRIRDAASQLGVSEAELVAADCGNTATRLALPDGATHWGEALKQVPNFGQVMALTRNEHCVHERYGRYRDVGVFGTMGSVVGPDIDLRFFLSSWKHAFVVQESAHGSTRTSVQFFDPSGSAIHKIYLQEESDSAAFDSFLNTFRSEDQSTELPVVPPAIREPDRPDSEVDLETFTEGWRNLQDTHEFFALIKDHKLGRRQALRLIGPTFAEPLLTDAAETLLRRASTEAFPIMVFVGNPGMIQIHTGTVSKIVPHGEWLNVLDEEFNLHLRQTAVTDAWVVRKPTQQGHVTSVELFDAGGDLVVQFFGKRKPGEAELPAWRSLTDDLPRAEATT